jgi:hypothetical protein
MKQNIKRWSLPLILVICYLAIIAVLALYADKQGNGGFIDFDYTANFVIFLCLTGPAFLMALAGLCWIIEFVRYKEYRYEKHSLAIASLICGSIFLIGIFAFFFLTLGIL